ncbi:hypothetical protein SN811_01040 [Ligilactobacillus agilis]|uniref:Uncharacterized protein n=1 Tax=Ligilactobacillus agilis TaxID=1601 RepID=A0A6F9Y217_9LACO|nr:hypothetical protein [Ligilactobacillus agilis]GET11604.1 hypothetical protein SN811_01040 [Ligilactobacillus agilis]
MGRKKKNNSNDSNITVAKYAMIGAWAIPVAELIKAIKEIIKAILN